MCRAHLTSRGRGHSLALGEGGRPSRRRARLRASVGISISISIEYLLAVSALEITPPIFSPNEFIHSGFQNCVKLQPFVSEMEGLRVNILCLISLSAKLVGKRLYLIRNLFTPESVVIALNAIYPVTSVTRHVFRPCG